MLRSDMCDYSDEYIVVTERITVTGSDNANRRNKKLTFKNDVPFRSCISKLNNTFIDNSEDLDIVMLIYNLLEYSDNYSMASGILWNSYWDEVNDTANEKDVANNKINDNETATSISFKYKTKIIGSTPANINRLYAELVVSLKYLSSLWLTVKQNLIFHVQEIL